MYIYIMSELYLLTILIINIFEQFLKIFAISKSGILEGNITLGVVH